MADQPITTFERAQETAQFLAQRLEDPLRHPKVAIVCGSGLGGLADAVHASPRVEIDYASIPHFGRTTVEGHAGKLLFGILGEKTPVVLMVGRMHFYEGHSIDQVTFPVRVFKLLGVDIIILTNAAGGLNPEYEVGDMMILNDHIFLAGLSGMHPLRGPNDERFGLRFPPLSDAYDLDLRRSAHVAWNRITTGARRLHEGVYAFAAGPSFETRAECRFLRNLGGDVVGMSTVPEIIVARHCGIRVLAFSLVTNKCVLTPVPRGDDRLLQTSTTDELDTIIQEGRANHEEVLEAGKQAAKDMQNLVIETIKDVFEQRK
ncbi:hypothetical protein VTN49DRAFT_3733 [Thermomyces lanuginosus]|uniref:uncharacterized protein n=1 Tax=Thermomyces lanuginosus TaxID=5541 RepID=UPI0037442855